MRFEASRSSSTAASRYSSRTRPAARLDHHVGAARALDHALGGLLAVLVDDHMRPGWVLHVPVLLAVVGVRLIESDVVPPRVEGLDDPPVVGRRAVPVRGHRLEPKKATRITFSGLPAAEYSPTRTVGLKSDRRANRPRRRTTRSQGVGSDAGWTSPRPGWTPRTSFWLLPEG